MIDKLLARGQGEWLRAEGSEADIVLSTRVRLARNISGFPFSTKIQLSQAEDLLCHLRDEIIQLPGRSLFYQDLRELSSIDRLTLVERHLISRELEARDGARGVVIQTDERVSLMLLEEDHLRMQVIRSGLEVQHAWEEMHRIEAELAERFEMAWDDQFGYLTACPTNVGTGLRVSAMLHLPALVISRQIDRANSTAQKIHMAVRGLYGEGSRPASDLFQISNQVTLGRSEEEICRELAEVVEKIVGWERGTRDQLLAERRTELEDQASRALGMLERARTMTSEEALQHLSQIRMGLHLGLVPNLDIKQLNRIFLAVQPGHLQREAGKPLDPKERDILRARKLQELMP